MSALRPDGSFDIGQTRWGNLGGPHWLYLQYAASGELLYIGQTMDICGRTIAHKRKSAWWPDVSVIEFIGPFGRDSVLHQEKQLIHHLEPRHNWMHSSAWAAALRSSA